MDEVGECGGQWVHPHDVVKEGRAERFAEEANTCQVIITGLLLELLKLEDVLLDG